MGGLARPPQFQWGLILESLAWKNFAGKKLRSGGLEGKQPGPGLAVALALGVPRLGGRPAPSEDLMKEHKNWWSLL